MKIQQINYVITTNKNIKCYGCKDNCEKFQNEKYVSSDVFHQHMKILKKIFSDPIELHFIGGEPLLHKELELLCKIAHEELPNSLICIHTNGILLNTLKDNQLLELTQNNNVKFSFYLYPLVKFLKNYQKKINRLKELNIDMYWSHEHIYFNKFSLSKYEKNCIDLIKEKKQLYINDNKIYPVCPLIQNIQYKIDYLNYIQLDELIDINQINKLFLQFDCSYCNQGKNPLSILYTEDYLNYESLTEYVYDLGIFLQIPFIYNNIQMSTSDKEFNAILNRYLTGWLDIYIPYNKDTLKKQEILKLNNLLQSQNNIDKFNLYFVSIDDDIETQQNWFEIFEKPTNNLNTYFLKGKSLYLGLKKFFKNHRRNFYILDISNLNILEDTSFLTSLIQK